MQSSMGIGKRDFHDHAGHLTFLADVVRGREGMMSLQRDTGHQPPAQNNASENSPKHFVHSVKV
jgi:hypothetical protein